MEKVRKTLWIAAGLALGVVVAVQMRSPERQAVVGEVPSPSAKSAKDVVAPTPLSAARPWPASAS